MSLFRIDTVILNITSFSIKLNITNFEAGVSTLEGVERLVEVHEITNDDGTEDTNEDPVKGASNLPGNL